MNQTQNYLNGEYYILLHYTNVYKGRVLYNTMENKDIIKSKINDLCYTFRDREIDTIIQLLQKKWVGLSPKQAQIKRISESIISLKNIGVKDTDSEIRQFRKELRQLFSYSNFGYNQEVLK